VRVVRVVRRLGFQCLLRRRCRTFLPWVQILKSGIFLVFAFSLGGCFFVHSMRGKILQRFQLQQC